MIVEPGWPPRELSRLDSKNWTPTPAGLQEALAAGAAGLAGEVDALILMDQVDLAGTGVVTPVVAEAVASLLKVRPGLMALADSRRGLGGFPGLDLKMNAAELARMTGSGASTVDGVAGVAARLAESSGRSVFVTMAELGIIGASPGRAPEHVPALALRGPIDVVGAGDAVTANLAAALAGGASLREALELAMAAASLVIHQLGTTGTATVAQVADLLHPPTARGTNR